MNYNQLSEEVQQHSLTFFNSHQNEKLLYHNLAHTESVLKAAIEVANHYQLNDDDFFIVFAAVWFHDTGYFTMDKNGHEAKGADMAALYLKEIGVDEQTINKVKGCILSTSIPQKPDNLLEEIVCDADMYHFGTDEFSERNKMMRKGMRIT